jgi:hypothetical protein
VVYQFYVDGDVLWQNTEGRAGFEDIFLFDREKLLCYCSLCNAIVKMSRTIRNVAVRVVSEGHSMRLRDMDNGPELERRIHGVISMCCFRAA